MLLKSKPRQADRRVDGDELGYVYELFVKNVLELERAKRDIENPTLQINECKEQLEKRPVLCRSHMDFVQKDGT